MADEKQQKQLPETPNQAVGKDFVASEDVNKRIKPAMAIIKELFARINEKREKEAQEKATKDAVELAQQSAEAIMEQPKEIYVSLDGDNIGNAVARAEEKDDEKELADISSRINSGQDVLKQWALTNGGKLIEAGGDEGLVKVPSHAKEKIEELRQLYRRTVGATATIGVGSKISDSTKARMLGKLRGKNQIVFWEPEMKKELDLRVQESGGEAGKIKAAGLIDRKEPESSKDKKQLKRPENIHRWASSPEELEHFKDEDDDEEQPWNGPLNRIAPEDEEGEEDIPESRGLPDWLVNEALSYGMEPHSYIRLLRSYGHEI